MPRAKEKPGMWGCPQTALSCPRSPGPLPALISHPSPLRQMLVREVHRRVLIEYVRPLMRVRIICTSSKMRAKVAHRLRSEAKQLQEFFIQLVRSGAHSLP